MHIILACLRARTCCRCPCVRVHGVKSTTTATCLCARAQCRVDDDRSRASCCLPSCAHAVSSRQRHVACLCCLPSCARAVSSRRRHVAALELHRINRCKLHNLTSRIITFYPHYLSWVMYPNPSHRWRIEHRIASRRPKTVR